MQTAIFIAVGYWLLAIGYWLLATGDRLRPRQS